MCSMFVNWWIYTWITHVVNALQKLTSAHSRLLAKDMHIDRPKMYEIKVIRREKKIIFANSKPHK